MEKKNKLTNTSQLPNEAEKTAEDNQWVSVAGTKGYMREHQEKTATNNQWVSTNKNSN